jgi:hypothetical protein
MKKFVLLFLFAVFLVAIASPAIVKDSISKVDSITSLNAKCEKTTTLMTDVPIISFAKAYNDSIADLATLQILPQKFEKVGEEVANYNMLINKKNDTVVDFASGGATLRIWRVSNSADFYVTAKSLNLI